MRTVMLGLVSLSLSLALAAGCGRPTDDEDPIEQATDPIVGGKACDTAVRASIVGVGLDSDQVPLSLQSRCSGTLIAPNLVLTARHCVAKLIDAGQQMECTASGAANSAVHFAAATAKHVFVFNDLTGPALAAATSVMVPAGKSLCNNDVALLLLDRRIPAKHPASVRALVSSTKAAVDKRRDPRVTVAGFGLLDTDTENIRGCQQKTVKVLADAAHPVYFLGKHEFSTGFGTCSGDSGGPVFDAKGLLVGVTSRGFMSCHGSNIYPDLAHHAALLAKALAAAEALR